MLGFAVKAKRKYYLQTLLEECKDERRKIKIEHLFDNDLEKSLSHSEDDSDYNDETESDDESNE